VTAIIGILIITSILTIILNWKTGKNSKESIPLKDLRMNRGLTNSLFWFGVGIPLFIESMRVGFTKNLIIGIISILVLLIGIYQYEINYKKREIFLEKIFIRKK